MDPTRSLWFFFQTRYLCISIDFQGLFFLFIPYSFLLFSRFILFDQIVTGAPRFLFIGTFNAIPLFVQVLSLLLRLRVKALTSFTATKFSTGSYWVLLGFTGFY